MKKVFLTNGVGCSGKDSFINFVKKYIPIFKYSSIDLVKKMFEVAGVTKEDKTEKKRLLFSDGKDLLTWYDDIPFKDITSIYTDFMSDKIKGEVLFIDIREPEELDRAVKAFGAKTILIRNPSVPKIETNHADANVENYKYDYIIENNGSLEQLDTCVKEFVQYVIKDDSKFPIGAHCIFDKNSGSIVFRCDRMLRD